MDKLTVAAIMHREKNIVDLDYTIKSLIFRLPLAAHANGVGMVYLMFLVVRQLSNKIRYCVL